LGRKVAGQKMSMEKFTHGKERKKKTWTKWRYWWRREYDDGAESVRARQSGEFRWQLLLLGVRRS